MKYFHVVKRAATLRIDQRRYTPDIISRHRFERIVIDKSMTTRLQNVKRTSKQYYRNDEKHEASASRKGLVYSTWHIFINAIENIDLYWWQ